MGTTHLGPTATNSLLPWDLWGSSDPPCGQGGRSTSFQPFSASSRAVAPGREAQKRNRVLFEAYGELLYHPQSNLLEAQPCMPELSQNLVGCSTVQANQISPSILARGTTIKSLHLGRHLLMRTLFGTNHQCLHFDIQYMCYYHQDLHHAQSCIATPMLSFTLKLICPPLERHPLYGLQ